MKPLLKKFFPDKRSFFSMNMVNLKIVIRTSLCLGRNWKRLLWTFVIVIFEYLYNPPLGVDTLAMLSRSDSQRFLHYLNLCSNGKDQKDLQSNILICGSEETEIVAPVEARWSLIRNVLHG